MSKEKAIEKIQYAKMQVASVYACSAIFDEKTKVIEGRQKELENTPIFPKIKTPPDERYADIWNW